MKKIILMAIAILFMFNFSFAINNPTEENNNKVVKVITKVLQYPASSKDNLIEGYVLLNLSVNVNGTIKINQVYSNKEELKDYVIQKLKSVVIDDIISFPDQTYDMKIVFKLL